MVIVFDSYLKIINGDFFKFWIFVYKQNIKKNIKKKKNCSGAKFMILNSSVKSSFNCRCYEILYFTMESFKQQTSL